MNKKSEIERELQNVANALTSGEKTDKQNLEIYAVQQALAGVFDSQFAASPIGVVMSGNGRPPYREVEVMDIRAN